jgi:hypothetical protein
MRPRKIAMKSLPITVVIIAICAVVGVKCLGGPSGWEPERAQQVPRIKEVRVKSLLDIGCFDIPGLINLD